MGREIKRVPLDFDWPLVKTGWVPSMIGNGGKLLKDIESAPLLARP